MKPRSPDLAEVLGHESTDKRIDILRRIGEGGSISEAARRAGVSYKAAWQAIETLGNLAGTPMVEKAVGGSGGGGAVLTPAGRRVLEAAAMLDKARADVLALLAPGTRGGPRGPGLAAMALRTSMRNQFPCVVKTLGSTAGLVRVGLELPGGGLLFSRITRESAQLLQLEPGRHVLALCKATAVRVAPRIGPAESRNVLAGTVRRASRAVRGGEVALELEGGVGLVGFAEAGDALKVGQRAMAGIEESGVVVAASA
jgi:molybdate transport system regulatory protein